MTKIMRRGIPVLGINALVISNHPGLCNRFTEKPPLAAKVYGCVMDAAVIKEMIDLYKPKAIYFIFSKSERAGRSNFGVISEYSALYNIRVGVVGSDAQFEAVKRVYDGDVNRIEYSDIRRDIAKVRNAHSEHAAALAKRLKGISDSSELLVAVFGRGLDAFVNCERIFDTYFTANGIRLKTVYINLLTSSVKTIREKLISPDLMVLPVHDDEKINAKITAVLASAAYKNIPYMTYQGDEPLRLSLPDKCTDGNSLEIAKAIRRISINK